MCTLAIFFFFPMFISRQFTVMLPSCQSVQKQHGHRLKVPIRQFKVDAFPHQSCYCNISESSSKPDDLIRGTHFCNPIEETWVRTVAWAFIACSNFLRSPCLKCLVFQAEPYTVHHLAGHCSLYCMSDVF